MSWRSGRDCAAITRGTITMDRSRNRMAAPAPGPAPGQKPWITATPIRIANWVPSTSSSRRRSVSGTGSAWAFASLGGVWCKEWAYCGNGEDWCTARTPDREGDQSTGAPRRLGPATGHANAPIVGGRRGVRDGTSQANQVAAVARRRPRDDELAPHGRVRVRDARAGDDLRRDLGRGGKRVADDRRDR